MISRCIFNCSRRIVLYNSITSYSHKRLGLLSTPNKGYRSNASDSRSVAKAKIDDPQLMIAFTCKKCNTRSSHTFSKQAYQKGTVAIQCPGCKNRHLIADNLNIFKDKKVNLEDILRAKGESISKDANDLVFEDIPDSLKKTIGHHAKDAPAEYRKETENGDIRGLNEPKKPKGEER
ncbi:uncharacterized protein PRCAT00001804001 [Priceomyces carsonii]|uniref:uncharacterized protein n=1 Tax=Priceomyces carsonii TaxID=28549 RepID=UPI002EDABF6C|nr:unnamed protein product [Priceomyces carsonii]